jgi:hypothetical protein
MVAVQLVGKHDDTVEVNVTDQGIGIPQSDLERIFERFYRVDPARSRATGGTGLGLSIVKHIITNHGGAVSVWSSPGSGSTFTIRLPRHRIDQVPRQLPAGLPGGHRVVKRTVTVTSLTVPDEPHEAEPRPSPLPRRRLGVRREPTSDGHEPVAAGQPDAPAVETAQQQP